MNKSTKLLLLSIFTSFFAVLIIDRLYISHIREAIFNKLDMKLCPSTSGKSKSYKKSIDEWNRMQFVNGTWRYEEQLTHIESFYECPLFDIESDSQYHNIMLKQKHPIYHQLSIPYSILPDNAQSIQVTFSDAYNNTLYKETFFLSAAAEVSAFAINKMLKSPMGKKLNRQFCSWKECFTCQQDYDGQYEKGHCSIGVYLNDICIRVKRTSLDRNVFNMDWEVDTNESLFLNDENEPGCYFNTINYDLGFTEWKPATYETTKPEYLTVTIRHQLDPAIALNDINHGCNTKFIFLDQCTNKYVYTILQVFLWLFSTILLFPLFVYLFNHIFSLIARRMLSKHDQ